MKDLEIKGQISNYFTPTVHFAAQTGKCSITGESYLQDAASFYQILIEWINAYFDSGASSMELSIKLTYFNTTSSRSILDMLRLLQEYRLKGKTIAVTWFYSNPDYDELRAEGESYMDETGLPIQFVAYRA